MNLTVRNVEDAIILALAPMLAKNGGKARFVGSYGGRFEEAAMGQGQIRLVMPAVLLIYAGSEYGPSAAPSFDRAMRFRAYHVSANPSSELARRHEAQELMEASKKLLNGSSLGLAITPLLVKGESPVQAGGALCVYAADYEVSMIEDATLY